MGEKSKKEKSKKTGGKQGVKQATSSTDDEVHEAVGAALADEKNAAIGAVEVRLDRCITVALPLHYRYTTVEVRLEGIDPEGL